MLDLEGCRKRIDEIDKEMTRLFEERMNVVINVAQYKKDHNIPIFNKDREDEVVEKNIGYLENKEYAYITKSFFKSVMEVSRELQSQKIEGISAKVEDKEYTVTSKKAKKVGYFGVPGSFTEEATLTYFDSIEEKKAYDKFEDIFLAVQNDEIDYGVLPIENSSTGAVSQVYDLLYKYGFFIVGEQCIKITENLLGVEGTTLESIKEVYSHEQPFGQSAEFLKTHPDWKLIPFHSTSVSAKFISDCKDITKAAIAGKRAADLYNLKVVKENINDQSENSTRFIIISKQIESDSNCDKVSVVFSIEHRAGTLYKLLKHFAENDINMIKIESRPMEKGAWKYFLYIDFEGNIESEKVKKALSLIEHSSAYFKLLGGYKRHCN